MGAALSLVRWVAAALVRAVVWPLCAAALLAVVGYLFFWPQISAWLGRKLTDLVKRKIGAPHDTPISMASMQLLRSGLFDVRGIAITELVIGNDTRCTFDAPHFVRIGSLQMTVKGLRGLISLAGQEYVGGSVEHEFRAGFTSKSIDTAELRDVQIFVEDGATEAGEIVSNATFLDAIVKYGKKKKAARSQRQRDFVEAWRHKWVEHGKRAGEAQGGEGAQHAPEPHALEDEADHQEPDDDRHDDDYEYGPVSVMTRLRKTAETIKSNQGLPVSERLAKWRELREGFDEHDKSARQAEKLAQQRKDGAERHLWRIGHLHVHDCMLSLKGHELRLGHKGWGVCAFIGDFRELKKIVAKGVVAATVEQTIGHRITATTEARTEAIGAKLGKTREGLKNLLFGGSGKAPGDGQAAGDAQKSTKWYPGKVLKDKLQSRGKTSENKTK